MKKRGSSKGGKNYSVGYGRPPAEHRWKPGQSGNRSGRKAGVKNIGTLLQEGLEKRLTLKGSDKTVTAREAIAQQIMVKAIKGDLKAIDFLMGLIENNPPSHGQMERITKDMSQQEAADVYMRMVRAESERINPLRLLQSAMAS